MLEKEKKINQNELDVRGKICDKMAQILQPCYLLLRGRDEAPEDIVKEYRTLLRYVQGIGNVSWSDRNEDDDAEPSNGNVTFKISDDVGRPTKRKHALDDMGALEQTCMRKTKFQLASATEYLSKGGLLNRYVHVIGEECLHAIISTYDLLKNH